MLLHSMEVHDRLPQPGPSGCNPSNRRKGPSARQASLRE